ncbi:MAG: tetratricopeptide repeat protein [Hormoscilla sp. GUM202]|nr:tetratricopeptide repeat protein [Hormoscilla sp. GUM202]
MGEYSGAIADYTKAIKINSDHALAYKNRGIVRYKLGEYSGAIADYTKAIVVGFHPPYVRKYSDYAVS